MFAFFAFADRFEHAQAFITPLTLATLSGHPVATQQLDSDTNSTMAHIDLARWADYFLIAPATANTLAKLAQGQADDLLSSLALACEAPLGVAPAMNRAMWLHPATQRNVAQLQADSVTILGPAEGEQACGETGPGRMLEPEALVTHLIAAFDTQTLAGQTVLITAGPTQEALDPIRFLTNHSSGKMGYALAQAALDAGANVILVSGPTQLTPPQGAIVIQSRSACEMHQAVMQHVQEATVFIAAAAVSDYRPADYSEQKLKKTESDQPLTLVRNPDILREVGALATKPFLVGFAAETENLLDNAATKLAAKQLDMIVANEVNPHKGFAKDENEVTLLTKSGAEPFTKQSKSALARALIHRIAREVL